MGMARFDDPDHEGHLPDETNCLAADLSVSISCYVCDDGTPPVPA